MRYRTATTASSARSSSGRSSWTAARTPTIRISATPSACSHDIPEEIYTRLKASFTEEQIVLLVAFAGIMYATNLFNTVARVPLDEVLYPYRKSK